MTDDLSMKALSGSYTEKTRAALDAGCDVVLHCNGEMDEMQEVAAAAGDVARQGAAAGEGGAEDAPQAPAFRPQGGIEGLRGCRFPVKLGISCVSTANHTPSLGIKRMNGREHA
jgi:hypothetical protein